jgi:hypothetical protein
MTTELGNLDDPLPRWSPMPEVLSPVHSPLPSVVDQAERVIASGLHRNTGLSADELRATVRQSFRDGGLLAIRHDLAKSSLLTSALSLDGRKAFVVSDMSDVDEFIPIPSVITPAAPVYVVSDLDRGDALANWSPNEALPAIEDAGRTPLTLNEGLHWLLQRPEVLERGHCFMTIGSRQRKPDGGLDARTPALWISNGTGRDGPANRDAPKVGWCWAGNRHTWLGFASAGSRNSTSD